MSICLVKDPAMMREEVYWGKECVCWSQTTCVRIRESIQDNTNRHAVWKGESHGTSPLEKELQAAKDFW